MSIYDEERGEKIEPYAQIQNGSILWLNLI